MIGVWILNSRANGPLWIAVMQTRKHPRANPKVFCSKNAAELFTLQHPRHSPTTPYSTRSTPYHP